LKISKDKLFRILFSLKDDKYINIEDELSSFEFSFIAEETKDKILVHLQDTLSPQRINKMLDHLTNLLYDINERSIGTSMNMLRLLLSIDEQKSIITSPNSTNMKFPLTNIISAFDQQVLANNSKITIEFKNETISYIELEQRSSIYFELLQEAIKKSSSSSQLQPLVIISAVRFL
jgi:hypothetical protein